MEWAPISEEELSKLIANAVFAMEPLARELWMLIRVKPAKWECHPWGDVGGGFWVVGILGEQVVWYNDIEEGFNISHYQTHDVIAEYWCNQDELQHTIYALLFQIQSGKRPEKFGPSEQIN